MEADDILVRFDIVSLYMKIPVDEAIDVIKKIIEIESAKGVNIYLKSTYFSYKGKTYEKIHGVGMGSTLS